MCKFLPLYGLVEHHRHIFGKEPIGGTKCHNRWAAPVSVHVEMI